MGARWRSLNQHSIINSNISDLLERFSKTRALTESLCEKLSDADATVQSMEDASPAKWHLAHSSWFFETFILRDHIADYALFDDAFPFLFNSYYEAEGERHSRYARGLITRPSLDEIMQYRVHVTVAVQKAISDMANTLSGGLSDDILELMELGINHEQQHQELLLTDILHLFSCNPIFPAIWPKDNEAQARDEIPNGANIKSDEVQKTVGWIKGPSGIASIGHNGDGFAFDCEGPVHDILLEPYAMADRTITNGEWLAFIEDGAYQNPQYWLSDGWAWVQKYQIDTPLYWNKIGDDWYQFGLDGLLPLDLNAPACHISLYEADAFASWASQNLIEYTDARLPTEGEWEALALMKDDESQGGHQLDQSGAIKAVSLQDDHGFFGNVWEWTGSAFRPYPKFKATEGAVGEYNGKFMSGQFVLKGGSCATPRGHLRASYRNFFYPHHRWQFTGLRLAKYIAQ